MDGAGTLRISARGVSAAAGDPAADQGGVVVEIADSGPDIPPDVLQHLFEPFFTTKDVGRGTGLGLDISRRIVVDRHGGEITVRRDGGETVFRVRLPRTASR
jgi:signal transduction histidine kinase